MGIMATLFGSTPAAAPTAPATSVAPDVAPAAIPATPGNIPPGTGIPVPPSPGSEPNGVLPVQPPAPVPPVNPDNSPLAEFSNLWDAAPIDPNGKPTAPKPLDPDELRKIVSQANFTSSITPENLAAIEAGGEGAQKAFVDSLNSVAQQVVIQSTLAANKMTEQAVQAATEAQAATIPDLIKAAHLNSTLVKENPVFSDPAVKPVIEAVQAQLSVKFPTATADQLAEMTQNFVSAMGAAVSPTPASTVVAPTDDVDWESHFLGK